MKTLYFLTVCFAICLVLPSCAKENEIVYSESEKALESNTLKSTNYQLKNWMANISNSQSIAKLSIPGTHDSGARFEDFWGTATCQSLSIDEQLNAGVRFLDIRCRHKDNSFFIHHGVKYQNLTFDDVLNMCYSFLNSNPTETIIMSIKEEHTADNNTRSFETTLQQYINKKSNKWYLNDYIPKLNEVRGKIILFRRFNANSKMGINANNWKDNTVFTINNGSASIKVQDNYKVNNNSNKWDKINTLLNEARTTNNNTLYLNYTSGYKPGLFGIPSIPTVSNYMNPKVENYFNNTSKNRFGVVIMDFVNLKRSENIVATNF
ncbi:phosphatidylinositol-specific phospholipase C [Saccharicrinis aurantiacus]|uniref:phosphatidylinositol-specific phospholipase C n=1 Tax=Saccharicrinis aurantiacus TaxID=1849719 RepID=UPI0009FA68B5|nr:phosphatidylinositol-specific phospholipase C [Saccharicrinis aurantiacus]